MSADAAIDVVADKSAVAVKTIPASASPSITPLMIAASPVRTIDASATIPPVADPSAWLAVSVIVTVAAASVIPYSRGTAVRVIAGEATIEAMLSDDAVTVSRLVTLADMNGTAYSRADADAEIDTDAEMDAGAEAR